jgi:hypothetical protein
LKGDNKMLEAVGTGITSVIGWIGDIVTALTATDGALAPLLALFSVGIAISAVMLGVKVIKSLVWGA